MFEKLHLTYYKYSRSWRHELNIDQIKTPAAKRIPSGQAKIYFDVKKMSFCAGWPALFYIIFFSHAVTSEYLAEARSGEFFIQNDILSGIGRLAFFSNSILPGMNERAYDCTEEIS